MRIAFVVILLFTSSITYAECNAADQKVRDLSIQQDCRPIINKGAGVTHCSDQSALQFAQHFIVNIMPFTQNQSLRTSHSFIQLNLAR